MSTSVGTHAGTMLRGWAAAMVFLFALSVVARLPNITGYLDPDSVDYVRAARMGCLVNALDLKSRPIKSFVSDCAKIFLLRCDLHVWAEDLKNHDVAAYRHYHPPLFYYLLGGWTKVFGTSNAALMLLPTLIGSLMAPALCWAWVVLFPAHSPIPGVLAGLFAALDPLLSHTGKFVTYHVVFALVALFALVFLARAVRDRRTSDLYLSAVLMGVCFATLENALILLASCVLSLLIVRNPWVAVTREGVTVTRPAFVAVLLTCVVFVVLWPAGALKLSFLKGYMTLFWLGSRATYETPLSVVLRQYFGESPVMMMFAGLGLILGGYRVIRGSAGGWILPLILFAMFVFVGNLGCAITKPTYLSVILPYLMLLAGWALWSVAQRVRHSVAVAAGVIVLCGAVNVPGILRAGSHALYFWPEVIEFFEQHAARGDQVLVSNNVESHVLAYYVPKVVVHHGYTWRSALAETAEKVRRGDYHFLMLIEFPPPPRQPSSCVSALPDFNPMKEKYRLVKTICHGPDDPGVRLFERVAQ